MQEKSKAGGQDKMRRGRNRVVRRARTTAGMGSTSSWSAAACPGHVVGAWVPDVLDADDEHEYDEPAPKKQDVYHSPQEKSWLLLLP